MSPASTACSIKTSPARFTTRTVPSAGISNVLSCEPYSSAACAIRPTLGTEPMVAGRRRRVPAVVDDGLVDAGVATSPGSPPWCRAAAVRRPTSAPRSRITAGIDASMMTSLGTCRLVMPRSESTIASAGPSRRPAEMSASIAPRSSGSVVDRRLDVADAVVGVDAERSNVSPCLSNTSAK